MLLRWAIAALALLAATAARADAPWVPDRVVVRFEGDGPHALRDCAETLTRQGRRLAPATADGSDSLDRLHARLGVRQVRALFRRPDARPFAEQRRRLRERLGAGRRRAGALPDLAHVYLVELPERGDVAAAVALYRADPHVVYAQPDYRVEAEALEDGLPDDPFFASAGSWGQPYPEQLFAGAGTAPVEWIPLGPARAAPVEDGPLGLWSLGALEEGAYVIRLAVTAHDGALLEAFVPVALGRNPPRLVGATGPFDSAPAISGGRVVWQALVSLPDERLVC